jgi:hypothetical protein
MESVKTIIESFKSETEKNNYIAQIKNLNNFCISRNIKTRFLIPVENIVLEGVQNKKSFNLTMIHILEVKD